MLRVILSFLLLTHLFTPIVAESIPAIYVNKSPVTFTTSPYFSDAVLYVPIRDMTTPLKGDLRYSRKQAVYTLTLSKTLDLSFKVNSNVVWIGKDRHFLSAPIRFNDSRVHIPLHDVMSVLGYSVKTTPNTITIETSNHYLSRPTFLKKTPSDEIVTSTGESEGFRNNALRLPKFDKDRPLSISFDNHTYDLQSHFMYDHGDLFVDILPILHQEGATSKTENDTLILTFQNTTYHFPFNDKKIVIQEGNTKRDLFMTAPILQHEGHFYFPLISFINGLDYGIYWNSRDRVIELLNKIYRVDLIKKGDKLSIKLALSRSSESYADETVLQAEKIRFSEGYFIDIPNSKLNLPKKTITASNTDISMIKLSEPDPTTTRLRLFFRNPIGLPSIESYTNGLTFSITTVLTEFTEISSSTELKLILKGTGPFTPNVFKDPKKLIIDIPNSLNELPQQTSSSSEYYTQIRSSQFSFTPLSSRIVLDFDGDVPNYSTEMKGNEFIVTLTPQKKKSTPPQPATPPRRKRIVKIEPPSEEIISKPKTKINYKHTLSGKTIVIDAGHGGRDPGAVVHTRNYEKTYTLDVATRLQKKLIASGASVIMTRRGDTTVGLNNRAYLANKRKADCFISIHFNSFNLPSAHGTETFYYKYSDKKLATHIQKQLNKDIKSKNNGIKRGRLYVLRHTNMPAALVEPGFMTNPKEFEKIKDPAFRQQLAESIYQGLINYYKD